MTENSGSEMLEQKFIDENKAFLNTWFVSAKKDQGSTDQKPNLALT